MNAKLLIAASVVAIAGISAANAECTNINGFYGVLKVGYGVTNVKDEISFKTTKLYGKKTVSGITRTEGGFDAESKEAYNTKVKARDFISEVESQLAIGDEAGIFAPGFLLEIATGAAGTTVPVATEAAAVAKLNEKAKELVAKLNDATKIFGYTVEGNLTFSSDSSGTPAQYLMTSTVTIKKTGDPAAGTPLIGNLTTTANTNLAQAFDGAVDYKQLIPVRQAMKLSLDDVKFTEGEVQLVKGTAQDEEHLGTSEGFTNEIRSYKNQAIIGLNAGYQHTIQQFYVGFEIGAEFTPGKTTVQEKNDKDIKTASVAGHSLIYDGVVPMAKPEITYKTKYNFNATAALGITCKNWVFYIPVGLKVTSHELELVPQKGSGKIIGLGKGVQADALSNDDIKVTPTEATTPIATAVAYDVAFSKLVSDEEAGSDDLKKSKTKCGFECGVGARCHLNDHFFVGVRYTYAPKQTFELDMKGYDDGYVHDRYRHGTKHKVSVESHKGVLEVGYKF